MTNETPQNPDALRRALAAIKDLRARLSAVESAKNEPIAVIGLSCRFPGGANNPDLFWQLLRAGRDAVSEVPRERWDIDQYYDPDPDAPGKTYTRWGGFLDQVDQFEPQFFGISPREAVSLDPQQRMLLEVSWEALEHAGIAPNSLAESQTGVYVGLSSTDYSNILIETNGYENIDPYIGTGGMASVAAGRVAFAFGLRGPTMTIDTACSSSLVTIHLACQSLRSGQADLMLAGGVNLILSPMPHIYLSRMKAMSATGRCKAFDAGADGFVRGEGCGVVVLKRLSDAQAAGDNILAVIRGTAINHDGHSSGLTVPNGYAQQAVIRAALKDAGLASQAVSYVETHGTGTPLGDPIEARALAAVMSEGRSKADPLLIGSVKTNLGHLESAAGIAAFIKVVLALQHGEIPPHLHLQTPSPFIDWEHMPFRVTPGLTAWARGGKERVAGVSAFGFSGTNAHLIVSEAPEAVQRAAHSGRARQVFAFSARGEAALKQMAARYAHVLPNLDYRLEDIAFTVNTGRSHFPYRLALTADAPSALSAALSAYVQGQPGPGVSTAHVGATGKPKVAFLFTGQGAQYAGMGRQLYETEPVFRAALDQCDVLLTPLIGESLLNVLYPSNASPDQAARIDHTRYTQPALFAIEYALAALWQSWGIEPYAVMGHSVGEYAAACVAGVFSLEDGVKLIAARGRLMGSLPAGGEMAAVFAPLERVQAALAQTPTAAARVSIAAMNGPENIVLSGAGEALREITARLETQGVKSRPLAVSHAFHSPLMDPILDEFERLAAGVRMSAPRHKLISNLTAGVAGDEVTQAGYWRRHIRQPVRFAESIAALAKLGCTAFVEIGPNPTLLSMAQRCLPDETAPSANLTWLPSLRKGQPEDETMLSSLGKLYTLGADIEWQNCAGSAQARKVALPTYPFQRQRYWMSTRSHASAQVRAAGMHPLLGSRLDVAHNAGIHIWQGELDLERLIYLQDHRIQGLAILPITAYLEMATAAAVETYGPGPMSISEVKIHKPLLLSDGTAPFMQMVLIRQSTDEFQFQIYSRPEKTDSPAIAPDEWTLHAQGLLQRLINPPTPHIFETPTLSAADFAEIKARCDQELTGEAFYRQMSEKGNQWGPAFQGVDHLWFREGEALSQVKVLPGLAADVTAYRFHPAVADSAGHVIAATLLLGTATAGKEGAFVAGGMDQSIVYQAFKGSSLWAYARLRPSLPGQENVLIGDVAVYDETGALIFETVGARLFYLDPQQQRSLVERVDHWMYAIQMEALPEIPESAIDAKTIGWLLFAEPGEIADALDEHLRRRGHVPVRVEMGGHFARHSDHRFVVDPLLISDFHQLFETIDRNPGIPPIGGIAYLWGLDMPAMDSFTGENSACDLLQAQERLLGGVIHIAQAVQTLNLTVPPRIWIVTQRAMPPLEEGPLACNPLQSALWGLGKSLAGEHGELWGGLIDLDTTVSPAHIASSLVASFTAPDPEDQVAWRNGRRYGLRLSRYKPGPKKPLEISADGAYWITGGLGGLGLQAASWLVQHGARRLVLFSRSKLPPQADWPTLSDDHPQAKQVHAVQALQELGANIWPAPVDVADQAAMDAFWHEYQRQKWPSVRGVIHAAGTMQYRLLRDHSLADLRELLRPKLAGAWLLHEMLRHQPLDFFVLYSSTSALLNSPLMASYAAANAFLDGFAYYRKQAGLPAVSINWGTWGEAGMALAFANVADQDSKDPRAHVLSGTITNQQGLQALEAVLSHADTQIAVTPVDWQSWQKKYPLIANAPFLSKLLQPGPQTTVAAPAGFDWNAFKAAVPAEKASLVRAHLSQLSAGILGFGDGGLDVNLSLSTLGLDSLMAIDLKKRIETNLKVNVPVAQILVGPSLSELTAQVLELLSRAEPEMAVALPPETKGDSSSPNETQPTAVETTSLLQDLDQFSDDDVDRMLRSMLNPKDSP